MFERLNVAAALDALSELDGACGRPANEADTRRRSVEPLLRRLASELGEGQLRAALQALSGQPLESSLLFAAPA